MFSRLIAIGALVALAVAAFMLNGATSAQTLPPGLVINEIYDSSNPNNEYFELYNTTSSDINLSNYMIYTANGSDSLGALERPIIRAGGFMSIGASQLDGALGASGGLYADGDFLALVKTGSADRVIDVVNWGSINPSWPNFSRFADFFFGSYFFLPTDGSRSLQRYPDGLDTNQGTDFALLPRSPGMPSCDDPFEDDDSAVAADSNPWSTLYINSSQIHRICSSSDVDFVRIFMQTTISYTIQTLNLGADLDTVMTLYDTNGTDVLDMENDNGPTPRSDQIIFRPPTSGEYYVGVTAINSGGAPGAGWLYTITMSGAEAPTATPMPTATALPYDDVLPGDYFYQAVGYLTGRGAISGYSNPACNRCFLPFNRATRGQVTKIVVLAAGLPNALPTAVPLPHFADVPATDPFYAYIAQAVTARIVSGYDSREVCGDATPCFRPYANVTRGQLAKIVVAAQRWNKVVVDTPTFSDVPADSTFYAYVEIAACHGAISGYGDGTFRPGAEATRGQIAKIVYLAATSPATCARSR